MKHRTVLALILIVSLILPCAVSAAEPETAPAPRIEANYQLDTLPECWNPLDKRTPEGELLLQLTADRLYVLSANGQELIPSMAVSLPQDVTEQYAGSYGIPAGTARGYAYLIDLDPGALWEDGTPISADDFLFTINLLIDREAMVPELANYRAYRSHLEKPTDDIVSLADAGFGSLEDAAAAGHTAFYVDTTHFWGLDNGWVSTADRSRLKDAAIPSGITEMYVSGAYLYDRYLRTGKAQSVYQRQFVGISAQPEYVTREDIGLIRKHSYQFVIITAEPTTAETLALKLGQLIPVRQELWSDSYATSPESYCACGPYRIVSIENGQILLERRENWLGKTDAPTADTIRLMG